MPKLRQETKKRPIPLTLERRHETQADGEFADQNRQWKTDDLVRELYQDDSKKSSETNNTED